MIILHRKQFFIALILLIGFVSFTGCGYSNSSGNDEAAKFDTQYDPGGRPQRLPDSEGLDSNIPTDPESIKELYESLKDDNPEVRMQSARAIGKVKPDPDDAVPRLIELLSDEFPEVRIAGAKALGEFGSSASSALDPLKTASEDENPDVRQAVKDAIEKIKQ